MRFNYDIDTDSLYINLISGPGVDSYEISDNVIVDVDNNGKIIGIEVLSVKDKVDLSEFVFNHILRNNESFIEA
jgi:uncharacterized protein YuzE